jgi:hypothetical protein
MNKPQLVAVLGVTLLLAPAILAQKPCSKLEVKGSGEPGTELLLTLSGAAANAHAWLAVGEKEGTTSFKIGPLGTLNLGLGGLVIPFPMGHTDREGTRSITVRIPKGLPEVTAYLQGFTSELTMVRKKGQRPDLRLEFCTSNVLKVTVGGTK